MPFAKSRFVQIQALNLRNCHLDQFFWFTLNFLITILKPIVKIGQD